MANKGTDGFSSRQNAKCRQLSAQMKTRLFKQYIEPNLDSIRSLTKRYTDHYQDVDDNYNLCLMQLYNYIGSYDPKMKLDTWIHICVKRACFHENKKRAEETSHWTDMEMCSMNDLYQHGTSMLIDAGFGTLADNLSDKVYAALTQMPAYRLSPFLLYAQGYGIREITSTEWKMGHLKKRSEDVVKSRIFFAKKQLQLCLRQYGITRKNHKGKGNAGDVDTEDDRSEVQIS